MGAEDTRTRIIDTALELFSRQGYGSTTTRSIAEGAGVNELTLFRNFGSKENLLTEVIDHHFDKVKTMVSEEDPLTDDPPEDLYRIITGVRSNLRKSELLFRLMLREVANNKVVAGKLGQLPVIMKGFMLSRIDRALGGRTRKGMDIETAGVFFASYFVRSEMMRILLGWDPFHDIDERRTREAIDIFLNGVLEEGRN